MNNTLCGLCPRNCKVNRRIGESGYCGRDSQITLARAALHYWEEPCISGEGGSGTVFFSGCPLRCVYCQNKNIALGNVGKTVSLNRLVEIFFELKEKGAHNINLVTPTHFIPQIREALILAEEGGLNLPIVYNTGSYENPEALKRLEGLVDIYLPDLKYFSADVAMKYSNAPDYFQVATRAIGEMFRQVGKPVFDEKTGLIKRGMIVRHLVLPGNTRDSMAIINYLYKTYKDSIYMSIMNQYTPPGDITPEFKAGYPEICSKLADDEYDKVVDYAISLGVENGFIQEGDTALESFIPSFDYEGV